MKKTLIAMAALFTLWLPIAAGPSSEEYIKAASFNSDGALIDGWYWLMDPSRETSATWKFDRIPQAQDITVRFEVTARVNMLLRTVVDAEFYLYYGPAPAREGEMTSFEGIKVVCRRVEAPESPEGAVCRAEIVIPRKSLEGGQTAWMMAQRVDALKKQPPVDRVIGFKLESAVLVDNMPSQPIFKPKELPPPGPKPPIVPNAPEAPKPEPRLRPFEGDHLPESDAREEAYLLKPGEYYGDLGAERAGGVRDNVDWFAVNVRKGEILRVTLDMKEGRNFNLALVAPNGNPLEASARKLDVVDMVEWAAPLDGPAFVKISRAAGQGRYSLGIDVRHQDDGGSGRDAGADQDGAVPIYPATEPADGQLLADDNLDFYSIGLEKGWELRAKLLLQRGQDFNLALLRPDGTILESSREATGESEQFTFKAQAARTFYIRVIRKSGEGHYKLQLSIHK